MSLIRRLFLTVSIMMLALLVANLVVGVLNAKKYLSDQLQALAEDTSTSLGLTISTAAKENDLAQIDTMINVIFDRGYYLSIVYSDLEDDVVSARSRDITVEGVPDWFIRAVSIPIRTGKSDVVSGWFQLGSISVVVHPGYAYRDMWRVFIDQLWVFFFVAVLFYGVLGQLLKFILKPIKNLESQANAIARKEFIVQHPLPRALELRRVVEAMNRMVIKVRDMFALQVELTNQLRRDAALDALTHIPNREEFDAQVNAWLKSESGGGACGFFIFHLNNLDRINDEFGRDRADAWLCQVAEKLKKSLTVWPACIYARRTGGDFSILIPAIEHKELAELCQALVVDTATSEFDVLGTANVGAVVSLVPASLPSLLAASDTVLRHSLHEGTGNSTVELMEKDMVFRAANEWRPLLEKIVHEEQLYLHQQPIVALDENTFLYNEMLSRVNIDNSVVAAGVFWPLVERFGLEGDFDRLVLSQVLRYLAREEKAGVQQAIGVNFSPASLHSEAFLLWLERVLKESPHSCNLVIEFPERVLLQQDENFQRFMKIIRATQAKIALDRFGLLPSSMGCLQSLPLDYVKIDSRFIADIDTHTQNQFYVRNLIHIAKSCDVKTIAEGVETKEQWFKLVELGIDAGQGFYFAEPKSVAG